MIDPQRVFVHLPYTVMSQYRPIVRKAALAVEVLVEAQHLEVATLETLAAEIREVKEVSGRVAIHSPYEGLDPGHPLETEREETLRLLTLTCALAQAVGASYVVAHTGYEPSKARGDLSVWRKRCLETFKELLAQPTSRGVTIAIENTYEPVPSLLESLLEAMPDHRVGVCLDTGHLNCFASAPPPDWWKALGNRLVVLHLHDNRGEEDEHLGIGQGTFDFDAFFRWLKRTSLKPYATIEGRDPSAVVQSLAALGYSVDPSFLDA